MGGNAWQPVVDFGDGDNDPTLDTERGRLEKLDTGGITITGKTLNATNPIGTDIIAIPPEKVNRFRLRLDQAIAHAKLTPEDGISISYLNVAGSEPEVNAVEWLEESAKVQLTQGSTANSLVMLLATAEGLQKALDLVDIAAETIPVP